MTEGGSQPAASAITAIAARANLGHEIGAICAQLPVAFGLSESGYPSERKGLRYDHSFAAESPMGLLPAEPTGQDSPHDSDARLIQLFTAAIAEALVTSDLLSRVAAEDIGLIIGTTTFGYSQTADFLSRYQSPETISEAIHTLSPQIGGDALLGQLCKTFELGGYSAVIGTACTSSAMAISLGHRLVASGQLKACLVGGFDVITPMTVHGFDCLQLLDPQPTRPFAADRAGINLGEGGAIFCLEHPSSQPADQEPYGMILGEASTCDAYDLTTPDPEARQIRRCIEQALSRCGAAPADVGLINTHGTGTPLNDAAEDRALQGVFGSDYRQRPGLTVQATKAYTGHLLGGAGALEAAIALTTAQPSQAALRLSCSFGFGGSNCCLLMKAGGLS